MRLSFGLETRQLQKQVLAPRMIQSMEILQLPLLQLQEKIEQELVENPVLELQERDPNLPEDGPPPEPRQQDIDDKPLVVDEAHNNADDFERLLNLDREIPEYFDESTGSRARSARHFQRHRSARVAASVPAAPVG